jgi:hypothetical protein
MKDLNKTIRGALMTDFKHMLATELKEAGYVALEKTYKGKRPSPSQQNLPQV